MTEWDGVPFLGADHKNLSEQLHDVSAFWLTGMSLTRVTLKDWCENGRAIHQPGFLVEETLGPKLLVQNYCVRRK